MNKQLVIKRTQEFVKETLKIEGTGHDWQHVYRVWKATIHIGKEEKADMFIVELAALLHDIADWKFHSGDQSVGPKKAREWLESQGVDEQIIFQVCEIIANMSFKGAKVENKIKTLEGKIVQDADRLDAIGAIGIGRAFAYGGHKNRALHDPGVKPEIHQTAEHYHNSNGTTINHFYEKLFLLKDLMNTKTGKNMAEHRHKFTEEFLKEFLDEWDGKK